MSGLVEAKKTQIAHTSSSQVSSRSHGPLETELSCRFTNTEVQGEAGFPDCAQTTGERRGQRYSRSRARPLWRPIALRYM